MNLYSIYYAKDINMYLTINSTIKTYSWKNPINFSNIRTYFRKFASNEKDFITYIDSEEYTKLIPIVQNKTKKEIINTYPELFI